MEATLQPADFATDAPGSLVKATQGYWTFVPNPLPPRLTLDLETIRRLSEAERALGQLAGVGRMLPNPHLLVHPFLRREAVLSSQIEGTIASLEQLALFEASPPAETALQNVREVANYAKAMEHGLQRLKELPVSLRLIREVHEQLLRGVRGEEYRPGEFRQGQNFIAKPGQAIEDARFVPPPVPAMMQALADFEMYLHSTSDLPGLVQLALIHYQFESIHPFMDGNGRIGRLLIALLLCERDYLSQPLLYLSAYFERNRDAYMDNLLRVSQLGAWSEWIKFFLRGVAEQSRDAVERSQRLLDLQQQYRTKVQTARASALLPKLVDQLFASPAITIAQAKDRLGVTYRGAQLNIAKLEKAGILREYTAGSRNRIYIADGILTALEQERM